MSKKYNDCDVVLELLPLYLDQKTGEESNVFVERHLTGCEACKEVYRFMNADFSGGDASMSGQIEKKANGRKKRFMRAMKRLAILILALVGYICLMSGIVLLAIWILAGDVLL